MENFFRQLKHYSLKAKAVAKIKAFLDEQSLLQPDERNWAWCCIIKYDSVIRACLIRESRVI